METKSRIISKIPQKKPFLFVDKITFVSENKVEGDFYLDDDLSFYKGHFPKAPITPGVILIEIMAQIGLVALGIFLLEQEDKESVKNKVPVLSNANVKFKKIVKPNQRVYVVSEKKAFRHNMLVCNTKLMSISNEIFAEGVLSGFVLDK